MSAVWLNSAGFQACMRFAHECNVEPLSLNQAVLCAVDFAKGWEPIKCGRHGMPAFLQVDSRHLHLACGRPFCCSLCPRGFPSYGVGWRLAYRLGVPHHLVC